MLPILKKIAAFLKKTVVIITVFLIVINLFLYFINKNRIELNNNAVKNSRAEIYKIVNDPKLNSSKEGKLVITGYKAVMCSLIGEACTNNPDDGDKNFNHSFFGFVSNLIILPYVNPPASGVYWTYTSLQNAGFFPKAYAAEGIGFAAIKPLMGIWQIFRDICYMALVLVLIVIGFMIMFRMKINPQTVISIENALPRIVVSLILITFSFAIAGFLIDLMYVIMAISISILIKDPAKVGSFQNKFLSAGSGLILDSLFPIDPLGQLASSLGPVGTLLNSIVPLSAFSKFLGLIGAGVDIFFILPSLIQEGIAALTALASVYLSLVITKTINGTSITQIFNDIIAGFATVNVGTGKFIGSILNIIIYFLLVPVLGILLIPFIMGLLIFFTIIFLFFRIFFMLLTSYLKILLLIMFSPLFALVEAIPGKNAFSYWFKNIIAEIATFPIVTVLLIVGNVIVNNVSFGATVSAAAGSPTPWAPPFLYGLNQFAYSVIIGLGLLFIIPDIVKLAKGFIGVKEGLPVNIGIGTLFGGAGAVVGGGVGIVSQFGSLSLGFQALTGKNLNTFIKEGVGAAGKLFRGGQEQK